MRTMKTRALKADEVTFTLTTEPEDIPIRGNALASGDDAADKECEDEIIARLDRGDQWAWCTVVVTARWCNFEASVTLGACSFDDEEAFRTTGGYYEQMQHEALDRLNAHIATTFKAVRPLVKR